MPAAWLERGRGKTEGILEGIEESPGCLVLSPPFTTGDGALQVVVHTSAQCPTTPLVTKFGNRQ